VVLLYSLNNCWTSALIYQVTLVHSPSLMHV